MSLRELPQERWQAYFDQVSKWLGGRRGKLEVTGLGLGDQFAATEVALLGLSYEPNDDTLTVFVEGLEHRVRQPRRIHIDQDLETLHSLEAVDAEGNHHIVQLIEPLSLPSP